MKRIVICLALLAGFALAGSGWSRQAQAGVAGPVATLATEAARSNLFARAATVCGPYGCYYRPGPRYYRPRYYAPRRYYYRPRYYAPRPYYRRYYAPRYHYRRW